MGLVDKKVGDFSLGRAFGVALSKSIGEQALAPLIGNGTIKSGGLKLIGAWGVPKLVGMVTKNETVMKITDRGAEGVAVDGFEDVLNGLFSDTAGRMTQERGALI